MSDDRLAARVSASCSVSPRRTWPPSASEERRLRKRRAYLVRQAARRDDDRKEGPPWAWAGTWVAAVRGRWVLSIGGGPRYPNLSGKAPRRGKNAFLVPRPSPTSLCVAALPS